MNGLPRVAGLPRPAVVTDLRSGRASTRRSGREGRDGSTAPAPAAPRSKDRAAASRGRADAAVAGRSPGLPCGPSAFPPRCAAVASGGPSRAHRCGGSRGIRAGETHRRQRHRVPVSPAAERSAADTCTGDDSRLGASWQSHALIVPISTIAFTQSFAITMRKENGSSAAQIGRGPIRGEGVARPARVRNPVGLQSDLRVRSTSPTLDVDLQVRPTEPALARGSGFSPTPLAALVEKAGMAKDAGVCF